MHAHVPRPAAVLVALILAACAPNAEEPGADGMVDGLSYEVRGTGEPILFIHGSYMEDALVPIIEDSALQDFRRVHYDRRGYGQSAARDTAFTFEGGTADALAVLQGVGIDRAHIVGYSLGGVIAFELAMSNPEAVRSLVLLEPPLPLEGLTEGPPPQFLVDGMELWQQGDHDAAVDVFFRAVASPDWREDIEVGLPGGVDQVARNADLFFEGELPAFEGYVITERDATTISQPILYLIGDAESSYAAAAAARLDIVESWLEQTEVVVVEDSDHALPMQQPRVIAEAIAGFVEGQSAGRQAP